MGCCKDCDDKIARDQAICRWEFEPGTLSSIQIKNMVGVKNPTLLEAVFTEADGTTVHDTHYAKMHVSGHTVRINIYRKKLPFDLLVASLNIDTVTGLAEDHLYGEILQFSTLSLLFEKDVTVENDWAPLGNGTYRVTSLTGARALFDILNLRSYSLDEFLGMYASQATCDRAVMVINNNGGIIMTRPMHPTWKDDSLWQ